MWLPISVGFLLLYLKTTCGQLYSLRTTPEELTICMTLVGRKSFVPTMQARSVIHESESFMRFIIESKLWVDKSHLITNIVEGRKINFITAPRGWGKSLNLNMLKTFYEIPININGNIKEKNKTFAYNYFSSGRILLPNGTMQRFKPPPQISKHLVVLKYNLGEHPVIYLNLTGWNGEEMRDSFKKKISFAFRPHLYLLKHWAVYPKEEKVIAKNNKERFERILNELEDDKMLLMNSILHLSKWLHDYHHKKVIILFDNYDALVNDIFFKKNPHRLTIEQKNQSLSFFKSFMDSSFKFNSHIFRAVITGTISVWPSLRIETWDDHEVFNFMDQRGMFPLYGFGHGEFFIMAEERGLSHALRNSAGDYYHGYFSYGCPTKALLSPWNIKQFLNNKKIQDYWAVLDSAKWVWKLLKYAEFRQILAKLNEGTLTNSYVTTYGRIFRLTFEECDVLGRLFHEELQFEEKYIDVILGYLSQMGYLAIVSPYSKLHDCDLNSTVHLRIPSPEIKDAIDYYLSYYKPIDNSSIGTMISSNM